MLAMALFISPCTELRPGCRWALTGRTGWRLTRTNAQRMYLAALGRTACTHGEGGGIYPVD
jgi:hypothetical protein